MSKITWLQSYEVLWIQVIDAICGRKFWLQFFLMLEFYYLKWVCVWGANFSFGIEKISSSQLFYFWKLGDFSSMGYGIFEIWCFLIEQRAFEKKQTHLLLEHSACRYVVVVWKLLFTCSLIFVGWMRNRSLLSVNNASKHWPTYIAKAWFTETSSQIQSS